MSDGFDPPDYFDVVSVPVPTNSGMLDDIVLVTRVIDSLCEVGGRNIRRGIYQMINLYNAGARILPQRLFVFRDLMCLIKESTKYLPAVSDLSAVLANVPCVITGEETYELINDFHTPYQQTTKHMNMTISGSLGVHTQNGACGIGCVGPLYVLDYIVPKYDGINVFSIRLKSEKLDVALVCFGAKFAMVDSMCAFAGEMMDNDRIMLYHCNELQADFPVAIKLAGKSYNFVSNKVVEMSAFVNGYVPEASDGFIFCINGLEYRVKHRPMIDLVYEKNRRYGLTRDNCRYDVLPTSEFDGIVEFELDHDILIARRKRIDRKVALSKFEVIENLEAPTVDYFRQLFSASKDAQFGLFRNVYPLDALVAMIGSMLRKLKKQYVLVSPYSVRQLLKSKKIFIDDIVLKMVVAYYTKGQLTCHLSIEEIDKMALLPIKYADCVMMYDYLYRKKIILEPYFICKAMSHELNVVTSIRRLMLMVVRGELHCIGGDISAKKVGGVFLKYTRNEYNRITTIEDCNDYVGAMCNYARNNNGKFVAVKEVESFESECKELLATNLSIEQQQEVGDVIMMWTKVLMRMYLNGEPLIDEDASFWQLLFNNELMKPFLDKMRIRIDAYHCVRHHETAGDHVCSNGIAFSRKL
jgi:hypothetical protein